MCPGTLVDAFCERAISVGGTVSKTPLGRLVDTVRALVRDDGLVLLPPELEELARDLRTAGVDAVVATRAALSGEDDDRTLEEALRGAGAGITPAVAAVAASGSVAVGPSGGNGGLLAALPPHHVCLVREAQVVAGLAEAVVEIASRFDELGGEVVFTTGPSRTADIEMMSVIGVHGPLRWDVVLIENPTGSPAGSTDDMGVPGRED